MADPHSDAVAPWARPLNGAGTRQPPEEPRPDYRISGSGALWVRSFDTVEELRAALLAFRDTYNATWLIERHGFRPPNAVRQDQISTAAPAA